MHEPADELMARDLSNAIERLLPWDQSGGLKWGCRPTLAVPILFNRPPQTSLVCRIEQMHGVGLRDQARARLRLTQR